MLTATIFLPLAGALIIGVLRPSRWARTIALCTMVADFILSGVIFAGYDAKQGGFQWVETAGNWIPLLDIEYHVAVDGLSAPLILLTGLLGLAAMFSSWRIVERPREYFASLLVLQAAVMGVFAAQDFILFFIFWELELVPMYLLISIWGSGRKEHSAMKFVIFTFLGSAFMFVGILALYFSAGVGTFDMTRLLNQELSNLLIPTQMVFVLFFIAFAVKLPIWPLHSWLPDAHTDAPTAVSVMLAGVLLKMGAYGIIRVNVGMFPDIAVDWAAVFAVLAVVNVLYGAMVTLRQTDLKRLIAFSSISHMGYVLLGVSSIGLGEGISPVGITGAAMQMFTHGTITGLLFVMVGLIYDKAHTRHIPDLGGLASKMPFIAIALCVAGFGSLGLPSTSGFVSEVMVFMGAFPVYSVMTLLAVLGILITAGYILWTVQRTLFGVLPQRLDGLRDATLVESVAPTLLIISILVVGLYPALIADIFAVGVEELRLPFA